MKAGTIYCMLVKKETAKFQLKEADACVIAVGQKKYGFVPRQLHLSGFIEETAKKLSHANYTSCPTAITHGAIEESEKEN